MKNCRRLIQLVVALLGVPLCPVAADERQDEAEMHEWEAAMHAPLKWEALEIVKAGGRRGALTVLADGSIKAGADRATTENYTVRAVAGQGGITAFRLEVFPDAAADDRATANAVLSEFEIAVLPVQAASGAGIIQKIRTASADCSAHGFAVEGAIDGNPKTGWATSGSGDRPHAAVFELVQPLPAGGMAQLTFTLRQGHAEHRNLTGFRITATTAKPPVRELPQSIREALALEPTERSPEQRAELVAAFAAAKRAAISRTPRIR